MKKNEPPETVNRLPTITNKEIEQNTVSTDITVPNIKYDDQQLNTKVYDDQQLKTNVNFNVAGTAEEVIAEKINNVIPRTVPVEAESLAQLIPEKTLEVAAEAIRENTGNLENKQEQESIQIAHARNIRDCQDVYYLDTPKHLNFILHIVVIFFIVFLLWAKFTVVDEATEGFGEVVPSSKVQVIQNLEGGIVSALHVKEGDIVKKNSKLITLSSTLFGASYQEQHEKYLNLLGNIARLNAQINMLATVHFPEELNDRIDIQESERRLFATNINSISSEIKSLQDSLRLVKHELDITMPLVKSGLMSQLDQIKLEKERKEIEGRIQEKKLQFIAGSNAELNTKQAEIASLAENLKGLHDRMNRTIIKSPTNGVVHNLRVNTIGGVITPGMEIVDIVPMEDSLLIEAKIRPMDIAFIHPGQEATVKVTAYDYSIYGGLSGKVVNISPDTVSDEKNNKFYKVSVKTEKNFLGDMKKPLPIIPGMMVTVHILTGKKSIMKYIFKPIINVKEDAFRER